MNGSPKQVRYVLGLIVIFGATIVFALHFLHKKPVPHVDAQPNQRMIEMAGNACSPGTIQWLKNRTYHIGDESIKLSNGSNQLPDTAPENETTPSVGFQAAACGDLTGTAISDAVVALYYNGGGSATETYILRIPGDATRHEQESSTFTIGDRISLEDISVKNRLVYVSYLGHGPDDPLCCASVHKSVKLKFIGNKFVCANKSCRNALATLGG